MAFEHLQWSAPLAAYDGQATALLEGHRRADVDAIGRIRRTHPRFLDAKAPWLPRDVSHAEIAESPFARDDARLSIARSYDFADWAALSEFSEAVKPGEPVARFEAAVEAVVDGDEPALAAALREDPQLALMRSTRRTHLDPAVHGAMLLHYVAANGVEGYRQRSPKNAPAIARAILGAGTPPDAVAYMYGGEWATMGLLVSSCHPAQAGVQVALVDVLADFGASVDAVPAALAFGYSDAARALMRRGARVDSLSVASGLGDLREAARLLAGADAVERRRALALAAMHGHPDVVAMLLDAGEDPNRFNPKGNHAHSTPLHQAALAGHLSVVRVLVERGARVDIEDEIYHASALGWARHGGRDEVAAYLESLR
ncbi:MAG: ankyrin repeat domain-containing protein [Bryobacteraceae bacterium]